MNIDLVKQRMTLDELNKHRVEAQRAGENNLRKTQVAIDRFVEMMGVRRACEVTQSLASSWQARAHGKMSARDFNNDLILLRKLFGHAFRLGVVSDNPFDGLRGMVSDGDRRVGLSLVGQHHIHDVLDRIRCEIWMEPAWFWRSVLWFMHVTGARKSQVVGLCWGDVDFGRRRVRLNADEYGEAVSIPLVTTAEGVLLGICQRIERVCEVESTDQVFDISIHSDAYGVQGLTLEHLDQFFWEFERRQFQHEHRELRRQARLKFLEDELSSGSKKK